MAENDKDLLNRVLKDFAQDEQSHRSFCRGVEDQYKAYRGVMETRSRAANWTSKMHPPYVQQIAETILASMVDPDPSWRVKPRPRGDSPEQIQALIAGAQANEWLLSEQADCNHLGEKQVVFAKQMLIAGLSVYKTFWDFKETPKKRQAVMHKEVVDEYDQLIGYQPYVGESTYTATSDDNAVEVVDVRDFVWHEAAVSLDKAKRVTHRVLYTIEDLKALEALSVYRNVSQIGDTAAQELEYTGREQDLFEANRAKDMVEVLEQWYRTESGIRVCSVANRSVVLRDDPNPFWQSQLSRA